MWQLMTASHLLSVQGLFGFILTLIFGLVRAISWSFIDENDENLDTEKSRKKREREKVAPKKMQKKGIQLQESIMRKKTYQKELPSEGTREGCAKEDAEEGHPAAGEHHEK